MSATIVAVMLLAAAPALAQPVTVTTHHYDNLRTGWNPNETVLTPANVAGGSFGLLTQVALDDEVDTQPLVVPGPTPGSHDTVYVTTEGNTVYAIDAVTGTVLVSRNLGPTVKRPKFCNDGGPPHSGITGTPVINVATQTLYVIAKSLNGTATILQLYALNLGDLTDQIPPKTVAASHVLSNQSTLNFDAVYHKQRPGLLESNGIIYAAFGSVCEAAAPFARGWILGWQEPDLAPLAANTLTDTLASGNFFMSSIWMAGFGVAADSLGNLYFATGNSAPGTYDGVNNVQESVLKFPPQLGTMSDIFTPFPEFAWDKADTDLASGGVMLLPDQAGPHSNLAVAAGKSGVMFLLDRNNLGGFTPGGPDKVVDKKRIGTCFCGPSYFTGADGIGRVVSSGAGKASQAQITVWQVRTSPATALVQEGTAPIPNGQSGGTYTTVSSNGTQAGTAIIWATGRPVLKVSKDTHLYALAAEPVNGTLPLLFSSTAGTWPFLDDKPNMVPVVANGRVYVASYKILSIYGLTGP